MTSPAEAPDPAKPDLYWAGHSGWAMMPGAVLGAIASAIVMFGLPRLGEWLDLPNEWAAVVRFWLVLFGWLLAGAIWAYRGACFIYRLTPTHLFVDFGLFYSPVRPIAVATITSVEVRAWALRRMFGVGAVVVQAEGRPPVRLRGIFRPHQFADAIRDVVNKARSG